jgi:hypothetical protein
MGVVVVGDKEQGGESESDGDDESVKALLAK